MTNFEPIKEKIWESVKSDNREEFNSQCKALIEKAVGDWWRIGWSIYPKSVDEVIEMLRNGAQSAHEAWIHAMEIGDASNEDVSPGEGFLHCAKLIEDALKKTREAVDATSSDVDATK